MTNQELYKEWRKSNEPNFLVWLDDNIEWVDQEEGEPEDA